MDLNLLIDLVLDRFHETSPPPAVFTPTALAQFLIEMGWHNGDQNSPIRQYFQAFLNRNTLSHIDYICGNARTCAVVGELQYIQQSQTINSL